MEEITLNKLVAKGFNNPRVLVLGDCMLDIYIDGECSRLAPDVAVPVLDVKSVQCCLGGAGNAITNLCNMGAKVSVITMLGDDHSAQTIARDLRLQGIDTSNILFNANCQTLTKTRLRRENQCLLRYDIGQVYEYTSAQSKQYIADVKKALRHIDIIFIADYDKGNITDELIQLLYQEQQKNPKIIAVDSKDYYRYNCLRPDLVKPNYEEACKILGHKPDKDRITQALEWSESLCVISKANWVALTLDKDGVILFKKDREPKHYPVPILKEGNFSGAGDTFLAVLCLAYYNKLEQDIAVSLSVKAAQIGIHKSGTASCSCEELAQELHDRDHKVIMDLSSLESVCDMLRHERKIVFTNGCFDIFHAGHAHYLKEAKSQGDILIVGINTDESIARLKGASRPINTLSERIEVLRALAAVDYIVPFGDELSDDPIPILEKVKPHVFAKGEAYESEEMPEMGLLQILGTRLVFIPHVHKQSTTKIIQRVQENGGQFLKKIS